MESNEEWNNFLHRVTEINQIVSDMVHGDSEKAARAQSLADKYLSQGNIEMEKDLELRVRCDKTIINKKACHKIEKPNNPNEMDPETFMREVSKDSEQRYADKKIRMERADTFKTRGGKAFRRGDFELALTCYNKAMEQIKDSCLLYTNRALTLIKLHKYEKVFYDCEWALRLNENSFKALLYRTKAYQGMKQNEQFTKALEELMEKFPQYTDLINEFLQETHNTDDGEEINEDE